jgi:hypothetical protein
VLYNMGLQHGTKTHPLPRAVLTCIANRQET